MRSCFTFLFVCFHWAVRVGIIYVLSAFAGTLVAALFVEKTPAVGSSGALYGLLGAMLSGLIQYWRMYTNKVYNQPFFSFSHSQVIYLSHCSGIIFGLIALILISVCSSGITFFCLHYQFFSWFTSIRRQFFKRGRFFFWVPTWVCTFVQPSDQSSCSK